MKMSAQQAKEFASDQEIRWCPGCGDYAILKSLQKMFAEVNSDTANTVFVSGIGCAARLPYYMSTYGFHTIHGRAPAIATGLKLANPNLDVWVISGDGDGLSIGGNHLLHLIRRNVDLQFLLFNNEIYGLTKGQYSPTSRMGTRSPSTPNGSVDRPLSAASVALAAGARFLAQGIDSLQRPLISIFKRAQCHKGTSFIQIFQNCIVYNDGIFNNFTSKENASDNQIFLEHNKPLVFGVDKNKGLYFNPKKLKLEVAIIGKNNISLKNILIHDESNRNLALLLAEMDGSELPVAIGVLYCNPTQIFTKQPSKEIKSTTPHSLEKLNKFIRRGHTWSVD